MGTGPEVLDKIHLQIMARVKIDLPEKILFTTEIDVRITDLNYGGHVGNDSVLSLIHEARMRFLKSIGFKNEAEGPGGPGIIMADAAIVYKAEIFYGDRLKIDIGAGDFTRVGFDLYYRFISMESGKELVHAKTGIICYDYHARHIVTVPGELLRALS